jgi:hypothetical protein
MKIFDRRRPIDKLREDWPYGETHTQNKHSHGKGPGEITGSGIIPCPIVDDFQEHLSAERQKLAQAVRVSMNEQMIEEAKTDL